MKDILTNGDYIRKTIVNIDDRGLAKVITSFISCCTDCPAFKSCSVAPFLSACNLAVTDVPHISEDCQKNFQNWLNSEKEENK